MKQQGFDKFEQVAPKRQEKTLREFKEVLKNLIYLLRTSVNADSAYLYWINRSREQFVKEAQSTSLKNARFEDRVAFDDHYFNEYKDIQQTVALKAEDRIDGNEYGSSTDEVNNILLIPFTNNDETVALTAVEWKEATELKSSKVIQTYTSSLGKLLNTYLEITNLYDAEQKWENYDKGLAFINQPGHPIALLDAMLQKLQSFLTNGSVSLVARGADGWSTVLNSDEAFRPLPVGLSVEKNTVAADALKDESDEFVVHFNGTPKRVSLREPTTEGATLAVPLTINNQVAALVLMIDDNPLVFKESTKHKLKNVVRVTSLEVQSRLQKSGEEQLLVNEYNAIIPDIWERVIDSELKRVKEERATVYTWAGFAAFSNLSELRTRLRAEELRYMQKDVVQALNPANFGLPGIVGFHTDYQYFILMQGRDKKSLSRWQESVQRKFSEPFVLSNGKQIDSSIESGFIQLNENLEDAYEVVRRAKLAFNSKDGENTERSKII